MTRHDLGSEVDRHRLHTRLARALDSLPERPAGSILVVDLDAFDANARDLTRRAAGTPVRVASKSLRVPALVSRALGVPGFSGVLCYALREALWLHAQGIGGDLVTWSEKDRARAAELVALYRRIRRTVHRGRVEIHGDPAGSVYAVEYGTPEQTVLLVYGRRSRPTEVWLRPRTLDPSSRYHVAGHLRDHAV